MKTSLEFRVQRLELKKYTILLSILILMLPVMLSAETVSVNTGGFFLPAMQERHELHLQHGEYMVYHDTEGMVYSKGSVVMSYGLDTLVADEIWYSTQENEFRAKGNVSYFYHSTTDNMVYEMKCKELIYDLDSEYGVVYEANSYIAPIYIQATAVAYMSPVTQKVFEGVMTTCDLPEPHYHLRAEEITIHPGKKLIARNVKFYIGKVPVMYYPYYSKSLKDKKSNYETVYGRSDHSGYFVKSYYNTLVGNNMGLGIQLEYHEKQGPATGADLLYDFSSTAKGYIHVYYIDEDDTGLERYRIFTKHRTYLTEDLRFSYYADYPSDNAIDQDYIRINKRGKLNTREAYVSLEKWDDNSQIRLIARQIEEWVNDTANAEGGNYEMQEQSFPKLEGTLKYQKISSFPLYYSTNGSIGFNEHYTGLTTSSNQSTYTSFDAEWEQKLAYPLKLTQKNTLLSSVGLTNSYAEKTTDSLGTDDFDTFLEGRLWLDTRWNRYLKTDLIYTAEKQLDDSGDESLSSLATHNLGGRATYRIPHTNLKLRWRGDLNLISDEDMETGDSDYYSRLDLTWYPNSVYSYNLSGIIAKGVQEDTAFGKYFEESQSIYAAARYQPKYWWWAQMGIYYQTSNVPNYITEKADTIILYPNFSTYIGKKWRIEALAAYNIEAEDFDETQLLIYRDLHCWEAFLRLRHTNDDDSIQFIIKLKAYTRPTTAAEANPYTKS